MPRANYDFLGELGRGSFGVVNKVAKKGDGSLFVCKEIQVKRMDEKARREANEEVALLRRVSKGSEYIVQYEESFLEEGVLHIVMEYCESGDLDNFLRAQAGQSVAEDIIWKFLIQIGLGLSWLHANRIIHRDIKTLNVFLTSDNDVRLGDLGVARLLSDASYAETIVGTPYYLSPELCEGKPYDHKSDVWAYGVVIYEVCALRRPFEAKNAAALRVKIVRGRYLPLPESYSPELRSIAETCLRLDPAERLGVAELLDSDDCKAWATRTGIPMGTPGESSEPVARDPRKSRADRRVRRLGSQISLLYEDIVGELDAPTREVWDNLYRLFRAKLASDLSDDDHDDIARHIFEELPTENADLLLKVAKLMELEHECDQHQLTLAA